MKQTRVVIIAFSVCIALSLLAGTILLLNAKDFQKYTHMLNTGKQSRESVLEMQLQERNYLLYHQQDALGNVKEKINKLRKLFSFYEKASLDEKEVGLLELAGWDEAINLYERLFDQLVLYHEAAEKNISEIRNLEKRILAVIYSRMNPERGIIALQEIRIHEKGYLLFRHRPELPGERSFEDKRKEAVSNLLMWARNDKRIEELMQQDNQLFTEILNNYASQDEVHLALKKEGEKIKIMCERFLEEGNKRLDITYRRCLFLSKILLIMWAITAIAISYSRYRYKQQWKNEISL